MIGRGSYGRPWLPGQAVAWLARSERRPDPTLPEQLVLIEEHYAAMLDLYGLENGVNIARKHLGWYTKGLHASADYRNHVNRLTDPAHVLALTRDLFARAAEHAGQERLAA
jgi:tRNA-dihydrouridine synthase B